MKNHMNVKIKFCHNCFFFKGGSQFLELNYNYSKILSQLLPKAIFPSFKSLNTATCSFWEIKGFILFKGLPWWLGW